MEQENDIILAPKDELMVRPQTQESFSSAVETQKEHALPPEFTPPSFESVTPTPPPMPPTPAKNESSPIKVILIGIVLVLIGTLIGVLAANFIPQTGTVVPTPTPIQTPEVTPVSTVQTLESSEYNFTVQMPNTWTSLKNESTPSYLFQYQAPDMSTFEVLVQDLPAGDTLTDYLNSQNIISQTAFEGKPSKRVISSNEITIGGLVGIEREEEFLAAGLTGVVIYIPGKTKVYSLSFIPGNATIPFMESETYKSKQMIADSFRIIGTEATATYTCPAQEFVDCMPSPDATNPQCQQDFLDWAKANCPGFQGAAL